MPLTVDPPIWNLPDVVTTYQWLRGERDREVARLDTATQRNASRATFSDRDPRGLQTGTSLSLR